VVRKAIDHSLLRPELTVGDVLDGCALAARYDVASVCVRPLDVVRPGTRSPERVAVGTVVGFPHGGSTMAVKVVESAGLDDGAVELDLVLPIGMLRSVRTTTCGPTSGGRRGRGRRGRPGQGDPRKRLPDRRGEGSRLSADRAGGADYVKTSTGFARAAPPPRTWS
jgi:deoxyribose-phosphate aldolase